MVLTLWERTHPFGTGDLSPSIRQSSSPTAPSILSTLTAKSGMLEPTPSPLLITYQVQPGDTLGDIALRFGVSVGDIMRLNGIEDANAINVGMTLSIPFVEGNSLTETAATQKLGETALEGTAMETPSPPATRSEPRVMIVKIIGAGDLATERVHLERQGEGVLSLENWQLQDEDGNIYIFPQLTLYSGSTVDVYTHSGINDVLELFWGLDRSVWESGEVATLLDDQGKIRATYTVP